MFLNYSFLTLFLYQELMNRLILVAFIISLLSSESRGQWYMKEYNVADINLLSREQLEESLRESKTNLLYSGIVSVAGAGIFLAGRYLPYEITDESSFFEQLVGEKGMKKVMMASGIGIAAGGAIAAVVYLGRTGKIKSVINEYYSFKIPFELNPAIIVNPDLHFYCPGFILTCNF